MTTEHQATRTLVKSPPELWAECSDAEALARHIGEFGEIRITRLEPETSVAWEGERASGTVQIEPSGWGTRVTLTAQTTRTEPFEDIVDESPDAPPDGVVAESPSEPLEGVMVESREAPPAATPDKSLEEEGDAKVEETVAESNPALAADPAPAGGRWKRLVKRTRAWFMPPIPEAEPAPLPIDEVEREPVAVEVEPEPAPVEAEAVEPEAPEPPAPPVDESLDAEAILAAALDSLGQAHHRPFSRA
jgi:hypothetical protein